MLTAERLRELVSYDARTGVFVRTVATGRHGSHKPGEIRVKPLNNGYLFFSVDGSQYLAHRLAWLYQTGRWPAQHIDHINGIRHDNRWKNLREASRTQNAWNARAPRTNTSGFKGVSLIRHTGKWSAHIKADGRQFYLGCFTEPAAAAQVVSEARLRLHGEFASDRT